MAVKMVSVFKLAELQSTAAAAVNITRTTLNTKQIVGTLQLTDKGFTTANTTMGMCVDKSGNIYLSTYDDVIVKMTEGGKINHFAGTAGTPGRNGTLQNVAPADARFTNPRGLACDNSGNIYVADNGNNQIRKISQNGYVSVLAGNGAGTSGLVDASRDPLQARFSSPADVAVTPSGVVYVADGGNGCIRRIYGGEVLNICGGTNGNRCNAKATNQSPVNNFFTNLNSICCDANGNIFTSDSYYGIIKKVTPNGWVYRFAGGGQEGKSLGTGAEKAYTCKFEDPKYVRCDRVGNVYVLDGGTGSPANSLLIKLNQFGVPSYITEFHEAGTDVAAGLDAMAVSPSGNVYVAISSS